MNVINVSQIFYWYSNIISIRFSQLLASDIHRCSLFSFWYSKSKYSLMVTLGHLGDLCTLFKSKKRKSYVDICKITYQDDWHSDSLCPHYTHLSEKYHYIPAYGDKITVRALVNNICWGDCTPTLYKQRPNKQVITRNPPPLTCLVSPLWSPD